MLDSSVHDIKATTIGADSIRFKAEIQFNGRVVSERFLMQANKSEEALLHRVQSSVCAYKAALILLS